MTDERPGLPSDNGAALAGFTREVIADNGRCLSLHLLIKPDTDLDSTFTAWCTDEQEFIRVRGWLFTFDDVETLA